MDIAPSLHDFVLAIEIDKIDCKPHAEGVNGFTWNDPQTFAVGQGRAS
jgi:hypothetical protein